MMRIKLFGLFIAYAMVALVRPREMRKLLEAADRGAKPAPKPIPVWELYSDGWDSVDDLDGNWLLTLPQGTVLYYLPPCPLPPPGWRCTRRAGHDGPCAAVVK